MPHTFHMDSGPRRGRGNSLRHGSRWGAAATLLLLTGCRRAPSFSVLGSYFPGWLFCIIVGVLLSFLLHLLLLRLELHEQLSPPLLVYPSLATLFSLGLWLVFFS